MATNSGGNNPSDKSQKLEKDPVITNTEGEAKDHATAPRFADLLKPKPYVHDNVKVSLKPVIMVHGEPPVTWKSSKVQNLILKENL